MSFSEKGTGVAIMTRWNEQFGRTVTTSKGIENHWFVLNVFQYSDNNNIIDNNSYYEEMNDYLDFYSQHCREKVSLEIVDYYCLPGKEMVGVSKTFWLKLIQRKWKKVYAQRRENKKKRKTIKELRYRERNGCWSDAVKLMPQLKGMLSTL